MLDRSYLGSRFQMFWVNHLIFMFNQPEFSEKIKGKSLTDPTFSQVRFTSILFLIYQWLQLEWTFGCHLPSEAVRLCNGFREDLVQPLFVSIRIVLPQTLEENWWGVAWVCSSFLLEFLWEMSVVWIQSNAARWIFCIPWRRKMFRSDQSERLEKQKHCYESYTFITSRVLGMARVFIRYFRKTNGGSILRTVPAIVSWGALPTDLPWKVSGK